MVASTSDSHGSSGGKGKGKRSRHDGYVKCERSDGVPVHTSGHRGMASPSSRPLNNPNSDNDSGELRFTISLAHLLSIIQAFPGFEWSHPLHNNPKLRDKSRFYEYHKDVEHKTNFCFQIRCLLNYLVSKGQKKSPSPPPASQRTVIDMILESPKPAHAWGQPHVGIFLAGFNYGFASGSARPIDGLLTFSESPLRQLAHPHDDALVLTLEVGRHLMKCILVTRAV